MVASVNNIDKSKDDKQLKPAQVTAIFFIVLLIIHVYSVNYYEGVVHNDIEVEALYDQQIISSRLASVIDTRFMILDSLHTLTVTRYEAENFTETFNEYSRQVFEQKTGVKVLTVSPNMTHEWVYPLEGNEGVLGHNLLEDTRPDVVADVQRAIDQESTAFSGPYELRQGGFGLVARKPVFIHGKIWGLVAIVLEIEPILQEAGLTQLENRYEYLLVANNQTEFFGALTQDLQIEPTRIELPEGYWSLSISPKNHEALIEESMRIYRIVSIFGVIFFTTIGYLISRTLYDRIGFERERVQVELEDAKARSEQAQELERLKTQFMNTATHEIRTPITSIKGYTELIQESLSNNDPELTKTYFEVVSRNVERLEALSNDLLDMQKLESGRIDLNLQQCELAELFSELESELLPIVEKHGNKLVFTYDPELVVPCDKPRITQVLVNLVENACKYSTTGTEVEVKLEKANGLVMFSVKDQGIGLYPEDINKLFKPFPDIHLPDISHGSGLGLSISKGIVDLHGGKIWAESGGKEKGSTFYITIPME